jgi:CheY-like chemotaxis protein
MSAHAAVLVVDDDASGRVMLSLSLRQAGHQVLSASSGEEALRTLERESFDCLVTDAKMQPMDGFELSSRAKLMKPALRIAMISAVHGSGDIRARPIEKFFPKPVPVDELLDWIAQDKPPFAGGKA